MFLNLVADFFEQVKQNRNYHQTLCYPSWEPMIKKHLKTLTIEELANTLTHGFGLVLSLFGFVLLVYLAKIYGDFWHIFSCLIYGLSLIALYTA